jgi:hypothetical protein
VKTTASKLQVSYIFKDIVAFYGYNMEENPVKSRLYLLMKKVVSGWIQGFIFL